MKVTPLEHLFHSATNLCGNCGNPHQRRGVFVIDARVDFLCRRCADSYAFTDEAFTRVCVIGAPDAIVYVRNGSRAVDWWRAHGMIKINF